MYEPWGLELRESPDSGFEVYDLGLKLQELRVSRFRV